jgi:hypothetical protein
MNSTLTSPDTLARLPLQRIQFFIAFNSPGSTTPLDRGFFKDDLTDFSSTNVALRAVNRLFLYKRGVLSVKGSEENS